MRYQIRYIGKGWFRVWDSIEDRFVTSRAKWQATKIDAERLNAAIGAE